MRTLYEDHSVRKIEIPTGNWVHRELYQFFLRERRKTFSMSFREIEEITDFKLPREAYRSKYYWRSKEILSISDAWTKAGYKLVYLDIERKKVWFSCESNARDQIKFPTKLQNEVPLIVKIYFEDFLKYIFEKYYPEEI